MSQPIKLMSLPSTLVKFLLRAILSVIILTQPVQAQWLLTAQPITTNDPSTASNIDQTSNSNFEKNRRQNREYNKIQDIEYARVDNIGLTLDLYLPKNSTHPSPTVVWIHGGAWRSGNKISARFAANLLAPYGYAVVGINYRLSQQAIFPAQIHDAKAAIRWIRAHAADYRLDPAHIGVWGSSAGGHLAALLGTSGDIGAYTVGDITLEIEGDVGNYPTYSSRVQAVVDWFGPTDFLRMDDFPSNRNHNHPQSPESRLIGGPIQANPELSELANPITYVSIDDPPFLIMHGIEDRAVPVNQSELLYAALQETTAPQGTEVIFEAVPNAGHSRRALSDEAFLNQVVAFFERHLRGEATETCWLKRLLNLHMN